MSFHPDHTSDSGAVGNVAPNQTLGSGDQLLFLSAMAMPTNSSIAPPRHFSQPAPAHGVGATQATTMAAAPT